VGALAEWRAAYARRGHCSGARGGGGGRSAPGGRLGEAVKAVQAVLLAVLLRGHERDGELTSLVFRVAAELPEAAADASHLVNVLARLLTPCTRCCWRSSCGGTCGTAC